MQQHQYGQPPSTGAPPGDSAAHDNSETAEAQPFPRKDTINIDATFWALNTARYLPRLHGSVLKDLANYVNVHRGDSLVWPSQDTIADNLKLSRASVCKALNELEAIGQVHSSIRTDIEGFHKQYRLQGEYTNWEPTITPSDSPPTITSILCQTVDQQRTEIADLEHHTTNLEEALTNHGIPIPERVSSHFTGTGSSSSNFNSYSNEDNYNYYDQPSSVNPVDTRTQAQTRPFDFNRTRRDIVRAWVEYAWEDIRSKTPGDGRWRNDQDAAVRWLADNYDSTSTASHLSFLEQVRAHARREQARKAELEASHKAAADAGLTPGTPAYDSFIAQRQRPTSTTQHRGTDLRSRINDPNHRIPIRPPKII